LKHGASSSRHFLPLAKEHEAALRKVPELDYLWESEFRELTWAYCVAQARADLVSAWVEQMETADWATAPDGGVVAPAETWRELATATLAGKLGLFPRVKPEVREAIEKARTRIAARKQRHQAKKAQHDALVKGFWQSRYPGDFDADGELRSVEDRLRDRKGDR
jgi:phytoene dehydrogenase-like protein